MYKHSGHLTGKQIVLPTGGILKKNLKLSDISQMQVSPLELNAICKGGNHCPDEQSKAQKYQILYHLAGQ